MQTIVPNINKNTTISIAKGIGIILMVFVHAGAPKVAADFICMFHMPLFFILSGYCFREVYIDAPLQFIKKRFIGLYKPYVKYGLLFLLLHNIFFKLNIYNSIFGFHNKVSQEYSLIDILKHAFNLIFRFSGEEQLLGGYWFLKEMFFSQIIFIVFVCLLRNLSMKYKNALFVSVIIVLCVSALYFEIREPVWGISGRTMLCLSFIVVGYIFKGYKCSFFLPCFMIVFLASFLMPASIPGAKAELVVPYIVCATVGTNMIICISDYVKKFYIFEQVLKYIGNNTLSILTWHFLSFKVVSLFVIFFEKRSISELACFPVIQSNILVVCLYTLCGIVCPLLISFFSSRFIEYAKYKIFNNNTSL